MMEEQTTWKGHTFTLLVFTGIVVLCSIFFILGMLVGRAQGQKLASLATASARNETKAVSKDDKQDFTFYDSVKKNDPPALQPPPAAKPDDGPAAATATLDPVKKSEPVPEKEPAGAADSAAAAAPPAPPLAPSNAVNYQVGAVRKHADAQKLLDELKKKGFRAFILEPPEGDPNPYFRVQVGPFTDPVEAEDARSKLEAAKYQVIPKK